MWEYPIGPRYLLMSKSFNICKTFNSRATKVLFCPSLFYARHIKDTNQDTSKEEYSTWATCQNLPCHLEYHTADRWRRNQKEGIQPAAKTARQMKPYLYPNKRPTRSVQRVRRRSSAHGLIAAFFYPSMCVRMERVTQLQKPPPPLAGVKTWRRKARSTSIAPRLQQPKRGLRRPLLCSQSTVK